MPKPRPSYFLPAVILILALPSAIAFLYVKLTGDQTMRPLSITVANLAENLVSGTSRGITIQINWGESAQSRNTRAQVEQALRQTMSVYPADFLIKFRDTPGDTIRINFLVNNTLIGPYQLQNVSSGIPAALAALQISATP